MTPQLTQQSILVVDDEPPMRKLLSSNLKASGYAVRSAADGTEGVETHRGAPVRFGAAVRGIRNEFVRACDMCFASKQKAKLAQPWDPASQSCQAAVIPDVAYEPV
jgi:CheY-like chemotaxis protein